jgi:hypothetical protein
VGKPTLLSPLERTNLNCWTTYVSELQLYIHLRSGEISKLSQHASEEGLRVGWDEARILEIECNSRYRKYKESAHMTCLTNPISQPSLDMFIYLC